MIEIGHPSGNIRPNLQSVVQVISNRAEQSLSVLIYQHLVMALNVAQQYPGAGLAAVQSILEPNLLI